MLQFSLWKKGLIWGACLLGLIFAAPNGFYTRVEKANDARAKLVAALPISDAEQADIDAWPEYLPSGLVNLGLDLRGGAHVLVEVSVTDVYADRLDAMWPEVRDVLRENKDVVGTIRRQDAENGTLRVRIGNPEAMPKALAAVKTLTSAVVSLTGAGATDFEVTNAGDILVMQLSEAEKIATDDRTMQQSLEIIRRRVDEAGTREPTIQRQGKQRILVQVPGLGSAEELLDLIGRTAKLGFHHVELRTANPDARTGARSVIYPSSDEDGIYYIVDKTPVVSGDQLVDAQPAFDQNGRPSVSFRFNPAGGRKFGAYTAENIGNLFAIVLDEEIISAPRIQSHIPGGAGIITGNFSIEESTRLAILLRAGALPAKITVLEQRTIGPELGQDSIDAGKIATIIAFIAVLVFMILSYGLFGLFANIALILNVAMIFALLSIIGATLTLPGIAGIVLTIGMAVDANVLIFERIREELKAKKGPARAIELGYQKALSAIIDANVTTLIAAVILFAIGAGPVRGFAVTLGLGIITSVFTAIWVTRLMISSWLAARKPKTIEV
ncbi:MAG: protein translocase subunit SecD [Paracoccaceae bacterium]